MSISTPTNEKPIMFSDPMIRAILNGTKTQTRRVITPQPTLPAEHCVFTGWDDSWSTHDARDADPSVVDEWVCPYGKPGTHLWVRECWSPDHAAFYPNFPVIYRSDGYDPLKDQGEEPDHPGQVSRITLRVESIRVERVNDISEEDAIAEGMERNCDEWNMPRYLRKCPACNDVEMCQARNEFIHDGLGPACFPVTAVEAFKYLWEKINGSRGFGWDVNPYVWVVGFERIKP